MTSLATIIDAGVGNLGNLRRALGSLGADTTVASEPEAIAASKCLLLPGVGAFRPPRETLRGELEAAIRGALDEGALLMGICVGYQLLFESSSEFGHTDGLALLRGDVEALEAGVSLPHIGWNTLHDLADHWLLKGIDEGSHVYFVHGFAPRSAPPEETLADCTHGVTFAAVSGSGSVVGTQFHPEKSGELGLRILSNFLERSGAANSLD